ncbi:MAG: murein hydrolase activator EnvC family protein [Nitrospinales bacterium]
MKRISLIIFVFLSLTSFQGSSVNVYGKSNTEAEITNLIKDEKKELIKLKSKIKKQNSELKTIGKKESSILKNLSYLENRLKLKERELKVYQWKSEVNKSKLASMGESIKVSQEELEKHKIILGDRLRSIYKEGNMFPIKVLFSADDINDLLQRIKYLELALKYDSQIFRRYQSKLKKLEKQKQVSLTASNEILRLEKDAKETRKQLLGEKSEKSNFLKKVKGKKAFAVQARKELMDSSEMLNSIIGDLKEKLILGKGLSFRDKYGRLNPPVKGRIINKFGRKKDKKYSSFIVHNGINIETRRGSIVRAIFPGKVMYKGALEGYGNLVIIGHGEDYHSLYGHLDKIHVRLGSIVDTGEVIGNSGDTGSLVGETLYFEIRHKGKAVEPTKWFRVAKK